MERVFTDERVVVAVFPVRAVASLRAEVLAVRLANAERVAAVVRLPYVLLATWRSVTPALRCTVLPVPALAVV